MRSFSDATRSFLRRLESLLTSGHVRRPAHENAQELRAMGPVTPDAIPALFDLLCNENRVVSGAAAEVIDASVSACEPLELARLDATVRQIAEWRHGGLRERDVVPLS